MWNRKTLAVAAHLMGCCLPGASSAQVRVTSMETVPNVLGTYPSWSPDGLKIAFERGGDLFTVLLDGTEEVGLAHHPALDETPVWSPTGDLFFASERTGELDVFSVHADGTGLRRVTDDPTDDDHPRVSPDGTRVVFNSKRHDGTTYQIWIMNPDGGEVRRLTHHYEWDTYPSLSADGLRLLWRRVLIEDGERNSEIFEMSLSDGQPVNLSNHPSFDGYPVWSPDERWVAFASDRDSEGLDQLFVMRADGSEVTRISPLEAGVQYARPSWDPSGRRIVATREENGETILVIFSLELQADDQGAARSASPRRVCPLSFTVALPSSCSSSGAGILAGTGITEG